MKHIIVILIALVSFQPMVSQTQTDDPFVKIKGVHLTYQGEEFLLKGVNFDNLPALGGELGDSGNKIGSGNIDDINVGQEDYVKLNELGGNVVRFGLDYGWYTADRDQYFEIIDQHVEWAREANVWIIWNQFMTPSGCYEGYSFHCSIWDSEEEQQQLLDFWVDMAEHYQDEPVVIGYGLLNEPTPPGPGWSGTWFEFAQEIRDAIAEVNTNHLVFISAGSDGQFFHTFEGDNVVYEVHDYGPLSLTHSSDEDPYEYPGHAPNYLGRDIYWSRDTLENGNLLIGPLSDSVSRSWTEQIEAPLFIGEWGTRGTFEGSNQFIIDKADLYDQWNIHHAIYTWRHDPEWWKWGIYQFDGEFEIPDQDRFDAYVHSWQDALQPEFEKISESD